MGQFRNRKFTIDLTGQKINRLTVLRLADEPGKYRKWLCQCECGNLVNIIQGALRSARTKSCGCAKKNSVRTHGLSTVAMRGRVTAEYSAWIQMRARCNPATKVAAFRFHYVDRGITVCERWSDFAAFLSDMGPRPSPSHSLDRVNNNGNYEPSNCRWATPKEQANNRARTVRALFRGQMTPLAEIARVTGLTQNDVWGWAKRNYRLKGTPLEGIKPVIEQDDPAVAHGTRPYKPRKAA